jgi:RNA polymerase sigma-70 factor, ECF subfamily
MHRGSQALRRAPPYADERSDDELMRLSTLGDAAAYEILVRRHQRPLRAYCARFAGSSQLGDDLAQECFVEIWRRRADYRPSGQFRSYLFHVAANRCKNQRRSDGRSRALYDSELVTSHEPAPRSDRFATAGRSEELERALSKLPEAQRATVLLRYSAELGYAEIAHALGVPEATARSRVFSALIRLRKLLRQEKA